MADPTSRREGYALDAQDARAFIAANIDWAKARVQARISRILWARNAQLVDSQSSSMVAEHDDDEYDIDAE